MAMTFMILDVEVKDLTEECFFYSKFSDEREDVQKKTFTKWINAQLVKVRRYHSDLRIQEDALKICYLICFEV